MLGLRWSTSCNIKTKNRFLLALRRRLFLLSAKFEEADQQFQEFKEGVDTYKLEISKRVKKTGAFDTSLELNLNTFQEFLSYFFPKFGDDTGANSRHSQGHRD